MRWTRDSSGVLGVCGAERRRGLSQYIEYIVFAASQSQMLNFMGTLLLATVATNVVGPNLSHGRAYVSVKA